MDRSSIARWIDSLIAARGGICATSRREVNASGPASRLNPDEAVRQIRISLSYFNCSSPARLCLLVCEASCSGIFKYAICKFDRTVACSEIKPATNSADNFTT